jgi:hypothetical protein
LGFWIWVGRMLNSTTSIDITTTNSITSTSNANSSMRVKVYGVVGCVVVRVGFEELYVC